MQKCLDKYFLQMQNIDTEYCEDDTTEDEAEENEDTEDDAKEEWLENVIAEIQDVSFNL